MHPQWFRTRDGRPGLADSELLRRRGGGWCDDRGRRDRLGDRGRLRRKRRHRVRLRRHCFRFRWRGWWLGGQGHQFDRDFRRRHRRFGPERRHGQTGTKQCRMECGGTCRSHRPAATGNIRAGQPLPAVVDVARGIFRNCSRRHRRHQVWEDTAVRTPRFRCRHEFHTGYPSGL